MLRSTTRWSAGCVFRSRLPESRSPVGLACAGRAAFSVSGVRSICFNHRLSWSRNCRDRSPPARAASTKLWTHVSREDSVSLHPPRRLSSATQFRHSSRSRPRPLGRSDVRVSCTRAAFTKRCQRLRRWRDLRPSGPAGIRVIKHTYDDSPRRTRPPALIQSVRFVPTGTCDRKAWERRTAVMT